MLFFVVFWKNAKKTKGFGTWVKIHDFCSILCFCFAGLAGLASLTSLAGWAGLAGLAGLAGSAGLAKKKGSLFHVFEQLQKKTKGFGTSFKKCKKHKKRIKNIPKSAKSKQKRSAKSDCRRRGLLEESGKSSNINRKIEEFSRNFWSDLKGEWGNIEKSKQKRGALRELKWRGRFF